MDFSATPRLTSLLERAAQGDETAQQELWSSCHEQLRLIASAALQRWNGRVSLQSTDVLHEAFARLVDRSRVTERGHRYFLKSFATECRRLLVEYWRAKQASVRGGDRERVTMASEVLPGTTQGMDLLELSDVIEALAREDARGTDRGSAAVRRPQCGRVQRGLGGRDPHRRVGLDVRQGVVAAQARALSGLSGSRDGRSSRSM